MVYCYKCGSTIKDNDLFCSKCGSRRNCNSESFVMPKNENAGREPGKKIMSKIFDIVKNLI